jgi:Leu/Phe-tRNA-protein transferase
MMFDNGLPWIDCQVYTDHLARFGAKDIPRSEYLLLLKETLKKADVKNLDRSF